MSAGIRHCLFRWCACGASATSYGVDLGMRRKSRKPMCGWCFIGNLQRLDVGGPADIVRGVNDLDREVS